MYHKRSPEEKQMEIQIARDDKRRLCPVCDIRRDNPCPNCGLSSEAMVEISLRDIVRDSFKNKPLTVVKEEDLEIDHVKKVACDAGDISLYDNAEPPKEESSMSLTPLTHRVLIRPDKPGEAKRGSIILPSGDPDKKQCQGEVVSVGPGRQTDDGKTIPMTVKKGQKVIYGEYSTVPIELNGEKFLLISEADILAIVDDAKSISGVSLPPAMLEDLTK